MLLVKLISDRSVSVMELANACSVTVATVRRWMRGDRISQRYAQQIATLIGEPDTRALYESFPANNIGSGRLVGKDTIASVARTMRALGKTEIADALERECA